MVFLRGVFDLMSSGPEGFVSRDPVFGFLQRSHYEFEAMNSAFDFAPDQSRFFQDLQVFRNCGLGDVKRGSQLVCRRRAVACQHRNDLASRAVAESRAGLLCWIQEFLGKTLDNIL